MRFRRFFRYSLLFQIDTATNFDIFFLFATFVLFADTAGTARNGPTGWVHKITGEYQPRTMFAC